MLQNYSIIQKLRPHTILLCLSFILFGSIIKAQVNFDYFSVNKLTQDDGLSQGSNYFRFEDSRGFIWITGNDAVNRYDGSSVKVYNLKHYFKNCTTLQQGYGFAEDNNYLYIGSTRGLYQYNYKKDEFTLIEVFRHSRTKTAIPIGFSHGKIWCFNEDWQLASLDVKTAKVTLEAQIPLPPIRSVHIYDNQGNVFYWRMPFIDRNSNIFFTGKENAMFYNIAKHKINFPFQNFPIFKNVTFASCAYDKENGNVIFGTLSNGIIILKNKYQKVENFYPNDDNISNVAVGKDRIIYRTERKGTFLLDKNFRKMKTLNKGFERTFSFGFDKMGRLWLCDDGQGQVILDFKGTLLKKSSDVDNEKIKNTSVLGTNNFADLTDGNVLIQGLIFNPNNYTTTNFPGKYSSCSAYSDHKKNQLWILNLLKDDTVEISLMDQNRKMLKKFNVSLKKIGDLKHFQTFDNNYPMISSTEGLFWLNTDSGNLEKMTSIKSNSPFYINKISNSRIIISDLGGDAVLAQMKPQGKVEFLQNVLPKVKSFYFQEDKNNGQIWAGTNEGIFLMNKNFKVLKKFDSNNGLAGTYIYGLIIDDFGKIWCSHQHGLSSIDTKNYSIINFDKDDGIQHWDYNNRGFYKTEDGNLFFGGVNGFNFFKPPLKLNTFYKPEIYFDEIKINNIRWKADKGVNQLSEINLNNKENNISIKALIKDLENGKRQRLMYRFANIDSRWRPIMHKSPLVLSSLSSGKYELEFGIYNKFDQKITIQKKLLLNIKKAFYQTFWFWALLGGWVIGIAFFIFTRWKLLKQKNYYRQQLALEEQRNKITADLHDDIGATLSSLQINSAVASLYLQKNNLAETQSILDKIQQQSQKLSENMGDIVWSLRPNQDALMTLSTRIRNVANEILGNTSINYHIAIDDQIDDEITDFGIRKNIILIVKEALNNAAKYSEANEVLIQFKIIDQDYLLEICDNGIGFNPQKKKGNGLENMKKRTSEMNGKFDISTENGTCVKIHIHKSRDCK